MGMGMGIVPFGKHRFCLRVVSRVGMRICHRVVLFFLIVAFLVLAGLGSGV